MPVVRPAVTGAGHRHRAVDPDGVPGTHGDWNLALPMPNAATARSYAEHTDSTGAATTAYIKASAQDVATALAAMTGEPHPSPIPPLAQTTHDIRTAPRCTRPATPNATGWHARLFTLYQWYCPLVTFPQNGDIAPVFVSAPPSDTSLGNQLCEPQSTTIRTP
jgi:hypothetical protein